MQRGDPPPRWSMTYQTVVLGLSALVILAVSTLGIHAFTSALGGSGSVSLGLTALGQVVGATAPHGPAAQSLPGLVGTPTPSATPTETPTRTPTASPTTTATPTPTLTPDVSVYDPARATTLLAQAQTSFGSQPPVFVADVTAAARRLNEIHIAPGETFSFNAVAGPYSTANGYQWTTPASSGPVTETVPTVASGITQVSTTLFQAVFWSGLKIVERHPHPTWLDRFAAGSTGQRGLDATVSLPSEDLKFQNTTGDWLRLTTTLAPTSVTVAIYGADPGWSVSPSIGIPSQVVQPDPTPLLQPDPSLAPGQQFTVATAIPGFDITVQRTVIKDGQVIDRYGLAEHYQPSPAVVIVGPTPTATPLPPPTVTPVPVAPVTPVVNAPTHLAGLNPAAFVLPNGRIRTPNLVGLPVAEAQQVIQAVGLQTTYVNEQGPGDVPEATLLSVAVGQVLSQTPPGGTAVPPGTTVYLAVRKQ